MFCVGVSRVIYSLPNSYNSYDTPYCIVSNSHNSYIRPIVLKYTQSGLGLGSGEFGSRQTHSSANKVAHAWYGKRHAPNSFTPLQALPAIVLSKLLLLLLFASISQTTNHFLSNTHRYQCNRVVIWSSTHTHTRAHACFQYSIEHLMYTTHILHTHTSAWHLWCPQGTTAVEKSP